MAPSTQDRAVRRAHGGDTPAQVRTDGNPVGCLPSLHSIVLAPLTEAELRELRKIGREGRSFEGLALEVMRTQATLAVMPPRDDPEALRGLRRRERRLLLEALSLGMEGTEQLRLAATLTRCVADAGDNLTAMLAAALETDCIRLGLAVRRGSADAADA